MLFIFVGGWLFVRPGGVRGPSVSPSGAVRPTVWQIYFNIWTFKYIGHKYLFGHSFISIFLLQIYLDIRLYQICLYQYICVCKN